jgi:hypothetical protein
MIDQRHGNHFENGVVSIAQKEEFRSFSSCGSCEGRQVERRLSLTPDGVEDLGKHSLAPSLDRVDELFWRLGHHQPAGDIAAPQVIRLLRPQLLDARTESEKIEPKYFSFGMLMHASVRRSPGGERICFTADESGRFYFTLVRKANGSYYFTQALQPAGKYRNCPTGPGNIVESR